MQKSLYLNLLFLLALAAALMLRQLLTDGYFSVLINDSVTYTSWAWQFNEALKEGIIYPRWSPLNFSGYGSPTFILYPPLAFYVTALLNVFTGSLIMAMNLAKLAALFLSAAGMFFLAKEFYSERTALLTGVFYMLLPINILQHYLLGGYASNLSLAWFPAILFCITKYLKGGAYRHLIYAGLCNGGLILTHLINAYMFTFVMVLFILLGVSADNSSKKLMAIPCIMSTGFLVAGGYLLPLIWEKKFINLNGFIRKGEGFSYSDFFIMPDLTSILSFHIGRVDYNDIYLFNTAFSSLLVLLLLVQMSRLPTPPSTATRLSLPVFALGISLCSILLQFDISAPVWEYTPFFKFIQFPSRWLNITALAIALLFASCLEALPVTGRINSTLLKGAIVFGICLSIDCNLINNANYFNTQLLIPGRPANSNYEHLPMGANFSYVIKNSPLLQKAATISGNGKIEIVSWKSAERILQTSAREPLLIRIGTFNFPGWKAYLDEKQAVIRTDEETGAILINMPSGNHRLRLNFEDTPVRSYGKAISLISIGVIGALLLI